MTENPEPPHGDPNRGLIGDEELPEDLQPDESSPTEGDTQQDDPSKEVE